MCSCGSLRKATRARITEGIQGGAPSHVLTEAPHKGVIPGSCCFHAAGSTVEAELTLPLWVCRHPSDCSPASFSLNIAGSQTLRANVWESTVWPSCLTWRTGRQGPPSGKHVGGALSRAACLKQVARVQGMGHGFTSGRRLAPHAALGPVKGDTFLTGHLDAQSKPWTPQIRDQA